MQGTHDARTHTGHRGQPGHYYRMAAMVGLSFAAMFALMYAMVDRFSNVFSNLNQVYMAGLMAAAMAIIEVVVMWPMYPNTKANIAVVSVSAALLGAIWLLIRSQAGISDRQFLRSMIPHHASAILMCEKAGLRDAEVKKLCQAIESSQQEQIDFMKAALRQRGAD